MATAEASEAGAAAVAQELRLARDRAEQLQRLTEVVLSTTPDLVYVFDLQQRFTFANKALLSMWGRTWDEAIGKNCLELGYEPWHAEMHGREIDQVVATKQSIRGEVAFNGTNGRRLYDYIFSPVFAASGQVEAIAGTTRDITEQRRSAGTLLFLGDLARDLATVDEEIPITRHAVAALGMHLGAHRCYFVERLQDNDVLKVSENWVSDDAPSLAGTYNPHDYGGPGWWEQFSGGNFAVADTEEHSLISQEKAGNYAMIGVRAYAVQPVKQPGKGTVVLCVTERKPRAWTADELATIENVAARVWPLVERARGKVALRQARDEALAASRAKDDFIAALSHELRTPLNPVLLLASAAVANPALTDQLRADFATIVQNVAVEARLIDDLLDLTRIGQERMDSEFKLVDVHAILQGLVGSATLELAAKGLVLEVHLGAPASLVTGDDIRLQQVFWNLLQNAIKFTPRGGKIMLSSRVSAGQPGILLIEVTDTGIGLTPSERDRLFKPLVQGEHSEGRGVARYGGLGLGLAISRKFTERHRGSISARSLGRDQGATFLVELPLATETGKARVPAGAEVPAGPVRTTGSDPWRVLLVEDHDPSRAALAQLLKARKMEVVQAASATEALEKAQAEKFDVVVSDIGLPDFSGYELMKALRASHGLQGIAVSGYGTEEDFAKSREAGFLLHLTKPIQIQALDRALGQLAKSRAETGQS